MKGIIIGGGIGGLTTALALLKKGFEITVYEQAPEIKEVGAGVWVAPNALKVFERLGIVDQIIAIGKDLEEVKVIDTNNQIISKVLFSDIKSRHKFGNVAIHRGQLQSVLLNNIPGDFVKPGKRFKEYSQTSTGIKAFFEDGTIDEADFLIIADGIKSQGRKQINPNVQFRYSGQTCWRFITEFQLPERSKMFEIWGNAKGLRAAYSHINEKEVYCYITTCADPGGTDDRSTVKDYLKTLCNSFQPIIGKLIDSCHPEKIIRSDLYDFKPTDKWTDGRVALLGDAAHATTPNLGQGACQAIEDAFVISKCLISTKDIPQALKDYQNIRIEKTSFITNTSWQLGQLTNTSGITKAILKGILKLTPDFISQKQFDKIYNLNF